MRMYTEYGELYKTYTQKYGPKTAIFLMVGSFYELYDIQNRETGESKYNVREITEYLGIQLSIKKQDIDGGHDGLFAGFPDYVMHKWAGRLTSAGWTVVVVDQVKDSRGKVKERKVSRILSPSTHVENIISTETPYVLTLYFKEGQNAPSFGAAALDLSTGTTHTYFGCGNGRQDIWTADDLVHMMSVFQPKELLIYWSGDSVPDAPFFKRIFGINNIPIHIHPVETLGAFSKDLVRTEYLQKTYSIKSILPPKTYLGLRSDQEELALLFLLQFVEEHYPSMLKSFHRNEPWIPQARLICGNHALTQLQMTGQNQTETVINLFNLCITPMGKRAIRERLLSPYSDANEIRARLHEIQEYLSWNLDKQKTLEKQLRFMFDIPRLHRKILCGLISPQEVAGLFQTYSAIKIIMNSVVTNTILQIPFTGEEWDNYIHIFKKNFTEDKAQRASNDLSAFNTQKYTEIGEIEQQIDNTINGFHTLKKEFSKLGKVNEDAIRLEEREKEPFGFKCSSITIQQLKKNIKDLPEGTKISELKSGGWVDCTNLQSLNTQLLKYREKLQTLIKTYLIDACLEISEAGSYIWSKMEAWVCHIDCTQNIGRVSKERGYVCPNIEDIDENGSSFEIKNIRHPLVESLSSRVSYVKHNVSLNSNSLGWLVYGMNASGKSTLMKATGLSILLAQAGCFVPAKEMTLQPFKSIYTRILNQDNLFAGLSSFAVEMSELRDILRNSDKHTLVLGDELCAGTESTSAQALVSAGIKWLSNKNAKFIFATHLHDIPETIDLSELKVDVWHLHVDYNPVTKKLIYDRSLRPGSGSTLYGLEVARAMDLPYEFIEEALKNRHKITGSTRTNESKKSIWNTEIVRKECEICKSKIVSGLEVHHIKPRESARNGILEDGTHMNNSSNLIVICQKCHDEVHRDNIEIGETKITSDGIEKTIIKKDTNEIFKSKKSKWSDEEIEVIKETLQKYKNLSLKSIRANLESKHDIQISEGMLGKIRKDI